MEEENKISERGKQVTALHCDFCGIGMGISKVYHDNSNNYTKYEHNYKEPIKFTMPRTLTWSWRGEQGGYERKTFWKSQTYTLDIDCYAIVLKRLKLERERKIIK